MSVLANIHGVQVCPDTPTGLLPAISKGAARVMTRNRIDWCCHGQEPFGHMCSSLGIRPAVLLQEIEAESVDDAPAPNVAEMPTCELIRAIEVFHAAHRRQLPVLAQQVATQAARMGGRHPALRRLADALPAFIDAAERHQQEEETELFPAISADACGDMIAFLARLHDEHEAFDQQLVMFRDWCDDYRQLRHAGEEPDRALTCLHRSLEEFEGDLMEHMNLENNILFPRLAPR